MNEMRVHDTQGNRLYLTADERQAFLAAARQARPEVRTFCETLHYTGCRISEALEITPRRVELETGQITFRSLKKRRQDVYRSVPVPADYLDTLSAVHRLREAVRRKNAKDAPLWDWTRGYAWKIIKDVMVEAGISDGPHRTAKGVNRLVASSAALLNDRGVFGGCEVAALGTELGRVVGFGKVKYMLERARSMPALVRSTLIARLLRGSHRGNIALNPAPTGQWRLNGHGTASAIV